MSRKMRPSLWVLTLLSLAVGLAAATDPQRPRAVGATPPAADVLPAANNAPALPNSQEYERDLARIDGLATASDLEGLVELADEIEQEWGARAGDDYARLVLNVSNVLANNFRDERSDRLSQQYALAALAKADRFSLDMEVRLLPFVARDLAPKNADDAEWVGERNSKVKLWLHAWRRLESEKDPNFDAQDKPRWKITPPRGTGLPSGVAPEAIKDARLRARYEADIAANVQKAKAYDRQYMLRVMEKNFLHQAEDYLVRAYSKPPFKPDELERHLNTYIADRDARERIKGEVKIRIAQR